MTLLSPRKFASIGLSLVAHLLCLWPARAFFDLDVIALLAVYATALHTVAVMERQGFGARLARGLSRFILTIVYLVAGYIAVVFSAAAGWAVPAPVWITAGASLVLSLVPRRRLPLRIPWALPLGIVVTASFVGWQGEEAWVRCEDVQRVRSLPGVEILVPSSTGATSCIAGTRIPIGRYPRKVFESLDDSRLLFTTQWPRGARGREVASTAFRDLDGSVCEMPFANPSAVHCVGEGRGHGLVEVPGRDTIIAPVMRQSELGPGRVLVLNRTGPLQIRQTLPFAIPGSNAFYDAAHDSLSLLGDYSTVMARVNGSDFSPQAPVPLFTHPSDVRFDEEKKIGLICGQLGFFGLVSEVDTETYKVKRLDSGPLAPLLPFTWGCDWDASHRFVYVTMPNLGLLGVVDRQSGGLVRQSFVGFGVRPVAVDTSRHLTYVGHFLSGEIVAYDEVSSREVRRWFAGRFVRDVRLTRKGDALLVTSNLGIVRIKLDEPATQSHR